MIRKWSLLVCVFALISAILYAAPENRIKIGYVIPGLENEYWVAVKDAAEAEAKKMNVDLTLVGAQDVVVQLSAIDDMIQKGVQALVVSGSDQKGIVPGVLKLNAAKIPVIASDSIPVAGDFIAKINTDPSAGGVDVGKYLLNRLGKGHKLFNMSYGIYNEGIILRQDPAKNMLKDNGWTIIDQPCVPYGRDQAKTLTETILMANPDLSAVYALNDDTALGILAAAKELGRQDVVIMGYDAMPDVVKEVQNGTIAGTVYQDNRACTRMAIDMAIQYINSPWKGTKVIMLPPILVTKDNVEEFSAKYMQPK